MVLFMCCRMLVGKKFARFYFFIFARVLLKVG